ncbi:MAG: T9SS type A sorting domain-containing protein [Chitinivibrionales bacterium]|nr:T9SS type A sorting domain-containing protein [Chitinivibrionales bacterium]
MARQQKIMTLLFSIIGFSTMMLSNQVCGASNGYQGYIFCASGATAYLLDPKGAQVHTWKAASSAAAVAYLLTDGSALFPIKTTCKVQGPGAYPSGRLQKIDWNGKVVWDATVCDETFTPGYDLDPMPNGNVLMPGRSNTGALKLVEFQQSSATAATIVWQYVIPDSLGSGGYINSLSYNPDLDYILVDINIKKKLVVIDHKGSGKIVYTYSVTGSGVSATHAAEWVHKNHVGTNVPIPDANHEAMRLNNLLVVTNSKAAIEVNFTTNTLVKTFTYAFSAHEGSVQRLPNGNTLVCAANNKATELSDNGQTVRTISLPGSVNRAYMYAPTYPGLNNGTSTSSKVSASATGRFTYNAATNTGTILVSNHPESAMNIRIYSLNGKMVYATCVQGEKVRFSTAALKAGVYYVDVQHISGSLRTSIVKLNGKM